MLRFSNSSPTRSLSLALLGLGAWIASAPEAGASGFTPGNVVVVRVGDGSASLTNASTAMFLDEYSAGGTLVQTIALPTAVSGAQNPLTNSGSATSEGFLNVSNNGQYLVQGGYGVAPGFGSIAAATSAVAPRVVGRIEIATGNVDTSTLLNGDTSYSANNIRGATSDDGNQFWTSGTAGAGPDGGVRYVASLGANTATQVSATVTNTRCIGIFGGQLYVSTASGSFKGVNTVGTGLPSTSGNTVTILSGFPSTTPSQYDFFFADANTLYVAEDGSSGATGGIEKWTLSGGTWTRQYTLSPALGVGCRGLSGSVSGGVATLYATTTQASLNQIVSVTDTNGSAAFTTVATSATNEIFRGVRVVPGVAGGSIVAFCDPGQAGVLACPCSNPPSGSGRGCDNSSATGGASISGSGTSSLSADSVVFTTANEKPTATSIVLQGTVSTSGAAFGQGVRCVGGSLKRLYVHAASGGSITAPVGADAPVAARSAALGDTISATQHRYYMVYYRDPVVLGGCPGASTFNGTNALDVTWNP